jgi:peptidyl-prolyl cis-trans isomerase SurA
MKMYKAIRFAVLLMVVTGFALTAGAGTTVVEEIIAQVNDHPILLSEYKRSLEQLRADMSQEAKGLELEARVGEKAKDALRDLIDQQLLVQQASEMGINPDADVVKRLDAIRTQMNLPSMEALEEAVHKQGMNYEDFKQNLKESIQTQQVISREVGSRIQITPKEISDYYDKHKSELSRPEGVRIQEILVITEGKSGEELTALEAKAGEALKKAQAGEDFSELAKKYSDDGSAANGGNVGFFEKGNMATEIETVAYALKKNQVSDVIKTKFGFLILKLLEHTLAGVPPLAEADQMIHERLYYERIQPALREYLGGLRRDSFIVVKSGYVDSGAVPAKQASSEKP